MDWAAILTGGGMILFGIIASLVLQSFTDRRRESWNALSGNTSI